MTGETPSHRSAGPNGPIEKLASVLPILTLVAAVGLIIWSTRLPFTAGSPFIDLFVPIAGVVLGGVAAVTAKRNRRRFKERPLLHWTYGMLVFLAWLVVLVGVLWLLLIFGLCSTYWTRTSC